MKKIVEIPQKGFTLLELLVVMMVIGVIASVLLVNFQSARERARDTARKSDLRQIKSALQLYYNDYQAYPGDNSGAILGCGTAGDSACTWGGAFSANGVQYMSALPVDPVNSGTHVFAYIQTDAGDGFELFTRLENASDGDIVQSQNRCCGGVGSCTLAEAEDYVICED